MQSARFDRLEGKIDKLSDAMVSLARAEEKILSIEIDRKEDRERMSKISDKLDILDKKTNESARTIGIIHKMFWVSFVAVLTYTITLL